MGQFGTNGAGNGQFATNISALAPDPANNVYVLDMGNFRVQKFTSLGVYLGQLGGFGVGNGQFDDILNGIYARPTGDVVMSYSYKSKIQLFKLTCP